jgi:hypothetical protein
MIRRSLLALGDWKGECRKGAQWIWNSNSRPILVTRDGGRQIDTTLPLLGTELSLSSRGRMTLGVGEIFWFISHTLPQCHTLQEVGDTYL